MRKAEHLRFAILAAQREGNRLLTQALKPLGITPSQAEVLRLLQQHGTLSLNGLGQLLVCESGTNPSRLVERAVAAGLVERRTDAEDRRYLQLSLTPEGERLATAVAGIEEAIYTSIDTASDGLETDALLDFLHKLIDTLPAGEALNKRLSLD
ncbi:DNA-binding MarR family transcriptional regulator [Kitasatospora sp. GAS204A]|uniref:MarR family winged helix-turn-helix transcriptional regulator n=1 Tax=unclassified Kitasatospora TaxID=2633591 RepID=UPI0024754E7B|nr:MarR family transcriptional regulator [Kitasatospora sp. GAS204B]MDH6118463.1 DNA-binding MarR family transcriptional regulator [Kitasatospora sp. GAS204B]